VVHGPGAVHLVVVAATPADRERQVAEYVRCQASEKLAPRTRETVHALLEAGRREDAIRAYFEAVGDEWDHQWLHLETTPEPSRATRTYRSSFPAMLLPRLGWSRPVRPPPVVREP
jgi:hypothetical protein